MKDNKPFYSRLCGKLLGDGCMTKQEQRQPRFQFMHRTEDLAWSQYCFEQLRSFLPLNAPVYSKVADCRLKKGFSERYIVQSKTAPLITELYNLWYPVGRKAIPFSFLESHLNEEALSWWYQDDGHLKIKNGVMEKIILSTDSFSIEENKQLVQLLQRKFSLQFSIDGQNRLVLYNQFQIIYFLKFISPWLNPSMHRKAAAELPLRSVAKRTTIYLPASIKISKPTAEINAQLAVLESLVDTEQKFIYTDEFFEVANTIILSDAENKIPYQIVINLKYRELLSLVRQQTGLSVSQIATIAFRDNF